jgi:hypothetical protein
MSPSLAPAKIFWRCTLAAAQCLYSDLSSKRRAAGKRMSRFTNGIFPDVACTLSQPVSRNARAASAEERRRAKIQGPAGRMVLQSKVLQPGWPNLLLLYSKIQYWQGLFQVNLL